MTKGGRRFYEDFVSGWMGTADPSAFRPMYAGANMGHPSIPFDAAMTSHQIRR
jgi:hypothetical protein